MNKKHILITGAAGMIGSGAVRHLNDLGMTNLLLVDDLGCSEKWKNLLGKQFVDLLPIHKLFECLATNHSEIESVIHLGACSDTTETNADYLLENNSRFTMKLCEWALMHKKRFIYASSAATYGDGSMGFSDDEQRLSLLRPLNMYGFSKQLVDLWLQQQNKLSKVVGLKYFNVFGPNEYHKGKMASMILKMTKKAQEEGVIELYQSNDPKYQHGGQCRDFLYVKDAVELTCNFLDPKFYHLCGIFNVGQGKASTWNELAATLFLALGKTPQIEYIPLPSALSKQYQNYTCADMRKLQKVMPHTPKRIDESVKEYVQEYLVKEARW